MQERRRAQRIAVSLPLELMRFYDEENCHLEQSEEPIEIVNISKLGMGIETTLLLPVGAYIHARIHLRNQDVIPCTIQIVRSQPLGEDLMMYGCEFVGIPTILSYILDEFIERLA